MGIHYYPKARVIEVSGVVGLSNRIYTLNGNEYEVMEEGFKDFNIRKDVLRNSPLGNEDPIEITDPGLIGLLISAEKSFEIGKRTKELGLKTVFKALEQFS